MPASSFADIIISKLNSAIGRDGFSYSSSTPGIANKAIAEGVTDYLLANTSILVSYSGIIPGTPPIPDPTVIDTESITGKCDPPEGDEFDEWVSDLESKIVSGFFIGPGQVGVTSTSPNSINCFASGLSITRDDIKSVHTNNLDDPQKLVWTKICSEILLWLNSCNIGGYGAINSSTGSSGSATVTKTIVT